MKREQRHFWCAVFFLVSVLFFPSPASIVKALSPSSNALASASTASRSVGRVILDTYLGVGNYIVRFEQRVVDFFTRKTIVVSPIVVSRVTSTVPPAITTDRTSFVSQTTTTVVTTPASPTPPGRPSEPVPAPVFVTRIVSDISRAEVDQKLQELKTGLTAKISSALSSVQTPSTITNIIQSPPIPFANRIDQLQNTVIRSPRVSDGTFTNSTLSGGALSDVSITGASTFSGTDGTFSNNLTALGTFTANVSLLTNGQSTAGYFTATSTTATSTISTGGFTIGTSQFVVQSGSGNVGLGTTSPYANLAIAGQLGQATSSSLFVVSSSTPLVGGAYASISGRGFSTFNGRAIDPEFVGETRGPTPGTSLDGARDVFVSGKYAYVANNTRDSLAIIDISSSTSSPVFISEVQPGGANGNLNGAISIFVSGKYAYVANFTRDSLAVIDISNPASPLYLSESRPGGADGSLNGARGVFVSGKYAYLVSQSNNSFAVVDISDPLNPTFATSTQGPTPGTSFNSPTKVFVSGKYAYVTNQAGDSLSILDISNPTSPLFLASTQGLTAGTSLDGAQSVFVSGKFAYVVNSGRDSLAVIDVSNPSSPAWVAETQGPTAGTSLDGANGIFVSGKYAYVTGSSSSVKDGLSVVDISNPYNPIWVAKTGGPTPGTSLSSINSVFISGTKAYVTTQSRDSLAVIDIGGADVSTMTAGNIQTDSIQVDSLAVFHSGLSLGGGLNVGNDALINGGLTISGYASTTSLNPTAFSVIQGNSGFGTTSPYARLSVVGETVSSYFTATTSTNSVFPNFTSTYGTTTNATSTSFFATTVSFTNLFSSNLAVGGSVLTTSGGNVGIGTTTPGKLLTVGGSNTNERIRFASASRVWDFLIGVESSGDDKFAIWDNTAGVGRLIIDTTGNMGIGTTTPASRLAITQPSNTTTGGLWLAGTDGDYRAMYMSDTAGVLSFNGGDTAGALNTATLNSAGAWTNASDRAYKENIIDLSTKYSLLDVLKLEPRFYTMKGTGKPQIGFIAQEVKVVLPEVVEGTDGSMGISYGNMVALVVQGLKDMYALLPNVMHKVSDFAVEVTTKRANVEMLCIGETCVTESQLKTLLQNANLMAAALAKESTSTVATSTSSANVVDAVHDSSLDITSPTITLIGANPANLTKGVSYADLGATVDDNVNHNLGVTTTGAVDTATLGTYTVFYHATDQAGNTATSTRTVIVSNPSEQASTTPVVQEVATSTTSLVPEVVATTTSSVLPEVVATTTPSSVAPVITPAVLESSEASTNTTTSSS